MRRFRSLRRSVVALLTGPNLWISHINESSLESFGAFFPASLFKQHNRPRRLLKHPSFPDHVPGLLWELRHVVPRQQHLSGPARLLHKWQQHDRKSDLYLNLPGIAKQSYLIRSTVSVHATFHLCACWPHLLSFRDSPSRLGEKDEPSDTNCICF